MHKNRSELSYVKRGGDTPLIHQTIYGYLAGVMREHADHEAVVCLPQGIRQTYGQLDQGVEELSAGLLGLDIRAGDRVGIWSTNNIEWVLLQLATARIGAVLVSINPAYRAVELRRALELARVQELFLIPSFKSSDYVEMLGEACPGLPGCEPDELRIDGLPDLRRVVVYDPADAQSTRPARPGCLTWSQVLGAGADVTPEQLCERERSLDTHDPINIQFTSGTTGFPKAVVLTHHNLINNGFFCGEAVSLTPADQLCVPVPFYHCFGMVVANLGSLTHGATVVIPAEHFDPAATLAALSGERCTAVLGVPTMFAEILEQPDFRDHDLRALRTGIMGGAPCPPELLRRVMENMHCPEILVGFGQTESSPATHFTKADDPLDRQLNTVGTNSPHTEVQIVSSETGALLPIGEQGEVCVRGHQVMRGYFGDEEATRKAIDKDGWLHTGDLGSLDRDGYLRITGRLKDMIIRGGENVYPAEVEAFYFEHPKVANMAVFGMPDDKLGEQVGAWIQLHEDDTA
ncbi:MAG: AMP-binding protein, partial [Planctomycetota bacterium]